MNAFLPRAAAPVSAIVSRRIRRRDGSRTSRASGATARGFAALGLIATTFVDVVGNARACTPTSCAQDLSYALRSLRRTPGFTITAILVAALGIGATTATFSIADHVLIRPLPFPDPDRLVKLTEDHTADRLSAHGAVAAELPGLEADGDVVRKHRSLMAASRHAHRQRRARADRRRDMAPAACSGCSGARRRSAGR